MKTKSTFAKLTLLAALIATAMIYAANRSGASSLDSAAAPPDAPMSPAKGIGLLHTEWGPGTGTRRRGRTSRGEAAGRGDQEDEKNESKPQPAGAKPPAQSPRDGSGPRTPSAWTFDPGIEGVDPMLAVGTDYVIATQDHSIAFFDKLGRSLSSKGGFETSMSATDFFYGFLAPRNADGTVNLNNNINVYLGFPNNAPIKCFPWSESPKTPCIDEFYDTRVLFDPASKRFFILSAARNYLWFNDPTKTNPAVFPLTYEKAPARVKGKYDSMVRRYFAFAISKTEDPRDGFYQWMTTESNYADWPRITVNNGSFVVSHNSPQEGKPLAYVFAVDALKNGEPNPPNFVYDDLMLGIQPGQNNRVLVPVTHYGDSGGLTYFVRPGNPVQIFAFPKPSNPWTAPTIQMTSIQLDSAPSMLRAGAIFRANKLYLAGVTTLLSFGNHGLKGVRVIRIPIVKSKSGILATPFLPGFMDAAFGFSGPGDKPGEFVDYELPALTVNKNEDMVIVYGRSMSFLPQSLNPEARFSIWYHSESQPRPSVLLQKGDFRPKDKKGNDEGPSSQDLATAVVDPSDDLTVWIAHEFADSAYSNKTYVDRDTDHDQYKMIVGRVKP